MGTVFKTVLWLHASYYGGDNTYVGNDVTFVIVVSVAVKMIVINLTATELIILWKRYGWRRRNLRCGCTSGNDTDGTFEVELFGEFKTYFILTNDIFFN